MSKFRVLGGDFKAGRGRFTMRSFSLPSFNLKAYFETVSLKEVFHISRAPVDMVQTMIDDENQISYLKSHPRETAFIATLRDKRKFIGITDKETFFKVVEAYRSQKGRRASSKAIPTVG